MTHHDNRSTVFRYFAHPLCAAALECVISYGQHFIDDQYLRLQMCCHSERKSHVHAGRVSFYWGIEEFLDAREVDDGVELFLDFDALHAEDGAIEEDIFAAGEFGVEAGADFEE